MSGFSFNPYPFRYSAKYKDNNNAAVWEEHFTELPNKGSEEHMVSEQEKLDLIHKRSEAGAFPLVNYSTQYALGCFEGLKAYPQEDGALALFRPDRNAKRFTASMQALYMPPFETHMFIDATRQLLSLSRSKGFFPQYDATWKDSHFSTATAVYIRPFTYPEGGIGLNISKYPWVIMYATEVGKYLDTRTQHSLIVSEKIRATPNGTGWIKCNSNYVISILAKQEAKNKGYTEPLFLDVSRSYVEECASCNVFFVLNDNTIVTPELGDTILPGITRDSIICIAKDMGFVVDERKISIEEVMSNAKECFATGTAVGVEYFGTLHYNGTSVQFGDGTIGEISHILQSTLKKIQYGLLEDKHNWLTLV